MSVHNDLDLLASFDNTNAEFDVVSSEGRRRVRVADFITAILAKERFNQMMPETSTLMCGGDHPYKQWYGTHGRDGLLQMYLDAGITPYIAINTCPTATEALSPGSTSDMMTWAQTLACQTLGAELVAHGNRHIQDWRKINMGITLRYSGAGANGNVTVSTTTISASTGVGPDDFSFDMTTTNYNTIAKVVAAIAAVPNWTCVMCDSLTGSEDALSIFPRGATDAKPANLNLAAGGGMVITFDSTVFHKVKYINDGTIFRIYADGRRQVSVNLAGTTFTSVIATINAVTGLTAALMNDQPAGAGVVYMSGSELLTGMPAFTGMRQLSPSGTSITGRLSKELMIKLEMTKCVSRAAAQGVTLTYFAQSGSNFFSRDASGQSFPFARGNAAFQTYSPAAVPTARVSRFLPHISLGNSNFTTLARLQAIRDALVDSPGFTSCLLNHKLLPDGRSGYAGITTTDVVNYDQAELNFFQFLQVLKADFAAKTLRTSTFALTAKNGHAQRMPKNRFFNPNLKNSGESLVGISGDGGYIMPGWQISSAANVSAFTVTNGVGRVTMSSATVHSLINQVLLLEPGMYILRMNVDVENYTSGGGAFLRLTGQLPTRYDEIVGGGRSIDAGHSVKIRGMVEMPLAIKVPDWATSRLISLPEPFNLPAGTSSIKLTVNGIAAVDNIVCSGATPAATLAHEVATAINAAVKAAALPGEYHTIASARNGRVYLTTPLEGIDASYTINVGAATANDGCAVLFGTVNNVDSQIEPDLDWRSGLVPVKVNVCFGFANGTIINFSDIDCQRLDEQF